jgi:hypothetical protein
MAVCSGLYVKRLDIQQYVTNFMELSSSWEAASCAATQEFQYIFF